MEVVFTGRMQTKWTKEVFLMHTKAKVKCNSYRTLVNDDAWLTHLACSNEECVIVYILQRHHVPWKSDEKRIK